MNSIRHAQLLLFWDYDTQWGVDADRSRNLPTIDSHGQLEFENTERLLELHAEYEVPACFAVVGAAALPGARPYHDAAQIRRLHNAGHEVASHSFCHEWLPALDGRALRETLRRSKEALEQCIGASVVSFVPPYNQPFDYPARWSFSFSERLQCGRQRTNLNALCNALAETGYRFCRVLYQPKYMQLVEWLLRRRLDYPGSPELIADITCMRLNTPCGFDAPVVAMLDRCARSGGLIVVYGHPHSLHSGNSQDEICLVPFLQHVQRLRRQGTLQVCLPAELVGGD